MANQGDQFEATLRKQSKKAKAQAASGDSTPVNREIIKPFLANPLIVPWPNIPRHIQTASVHALRQLIPDDIASYHVGRDRCHRKEKSQDRARKHRAANKVAREGIKEAVGSNAADEGGGGEESDEGDITASASGPSTVKRLLSPQPGTTIKKKRKITHDTTDLTPGPSNTRPANPQTPAVRPTPPPLLDHLVFGINEVVKMLERQSDQLRIRIMEIGDVLAKYQRGGKGGKGNGKGRCKGGYERELVPTAPTGDDENVATNTVTSHATTKPTATISKTSPLQYIIIPLGSINPPTLVSHIPPYAATHNTLVYQYNHLVRVARSRLSVDTFEKSIGAVGQDGKAEEEEEVRVVPLGRVEEELAQMAGLRRLACVGVRTSHPDISTLHTLLPKSILHPPRYSLTLPFPIPSLNLAVHDSNANQIIPGQHDQPVRQDKQSADITRPTITNGGNPSTGSTGSSQDRLLAHIHYAPVHVKGITTTIPADGNARKAKRMEGVRNRRREIKEERKLSGRGNISGKDKGKGKAGVEKGKKGQMSGKSDVQSELRGGGSGEGSRKSRGTGVSTLLPAH